jgi:DNA-directed RNA polymerase I subunit RPA1
MADPVINKRVGSIGFGFFTGDEIKRLSVKHITVPYAFDNLDQPVPSGLYDRALGPLGKFDR